MKLTLRRKISVIFGYRESGKSVLARYLASQFGNKALYYDTLHEVPSRANFLSYKPKHRDGGLLAVAELEQVTRLVKDNHQFDLYVIDEANRFCPPKPQPLPPSISDLNDWCRHPPYEIGVIFVARRPTQLNTDLVELADYVIVFNLGGKNDTRYLNDLASGMGDTVGKLDDWHFVVAPNKRSDYEVHVPIDLDKIPAHPRQYDLDSDSTDVLE